MKSCNCLVDVQPDYVFVQCAVSRCLEALRQTLPRDAAMLIHCRWYCHRNQPGGTAGQIEWHQFVLCLLGIMGYSADAALRPVLTNTVSIIDAVFTSRTFSTVTLDTPDSVKNMDASSLLAFLENNAFRVDVLFFGLFLFFL